MVRFMSRLRHVHHRRKGYQVNNGMSIHVAKAWWRLLHRVFQPLVIELCLRVLSSLLLAHSVKLEVM